MRQNFAAKMCRIVPLLFLATCWFVGNGCRSTRESGAAGFAMVLISGNTPGQIGAVAVDVFREQGYLVSQDDPSSLVFEKKASAMSNIAYGSWLGDTPIWLRVKAAVVPAGEMTFRLQCAAYRVSDKGSAAEEEVAISHLGNRPYQKLLDEVARRLRR